MRQKGLHVSAHGFRLAAPPETLDDDPPLAALMTRRLLGITPDADVRIALRLLAEAAVRHLPVMDGAHCRGLVFEDDVLRWVAGGCLSDKSPIGELCRPVPALAPADRRSAAATRMGAAGVDAVLVVADKKLVGIVTATDVLRSLAGAPTGGATTHKSSTKAHSAP